MGTGIKKLITHDSSFHTDDVFACATLMMVLKKQGLEYEVIRSRDPEVIKTGDYVFDVGGVYDPEQNKFDHHQSGGAGARENGVEYASFGLVWKKFGTELCESKEVVEFIDKKLAAPIDAWDNGVDLVETTHEVTPYFIQNVFFGMEPTWKEGITLDEMFLKSVAIAEQILTREIIHTNDALTAQTMVLEAYETAPDKRIVVLEKKYPFQFALNSLPEPLFVIYPRVDKLWGSKAVLDNLKSFKNRKEFPASWGGLRDEELQKATGVPDATFCHRGLFLAVAKSKEGAVALAQKALLESST